MITLWTLYKFIISLIKYGDDSQEIIIQENLLRFEDYFRGDPSEGWRQYLLVYFNDLIILIYNKIWSSYVVIFCIVQIKFMII